MNTTKSSFSPLAKLSAGFAACATLSAIAFAAVTFDSSTGCGFVGKGDVQLAFGWNNAQLQSNAAGVSFEYIMAQSFEGVCTWTTGEGKRGEKTHNVTHTSSANVSSAIAVDARRNGQGMVTGFTLNGFCDALGTAANVPVVGTPCMGNEGHGGLWTSVTTLGSTGGLYVSHGSQSVLLQ